MELHAPRLAATLLLAMAVASRMRSCASGQDALAIAAKDPRWRIDLRTAQACELRLLPGIGPTRAAAMLREREQSGAFSRWDDLEKVDGLGPARIEALRRGPVLPLENAPVQEEFRYNRRDARKEESR